MVLSLKRLATPSGRLTVDRGDSRGRSRLGPWSSARSRAPGDARVSTHPLRGLSRQSTTQIREEREFPRGHGGVGPALQVTLPAR